jgi:uncharacterized protein YoxC
MIMDISDLSKLILAVAASISIVGISIQLMKLLGAVTRNVDDLRKTVKNVGMLTEGFVEDQKLVKAGLEKLVKASGKIEEFIEVISEKIIKPIEVISTFLTTVAGFVKGVQGKYFRKKQ